MKYNVEWIFSDTLNIIEVYENQAVRLPKEMEFQGVNELAINKDGDIITLRPVRPDWLSFTEIEKADSDFMLEREDGCKSWLL